MGLTELFLIAVGLSMDAFAVSICKGLSVKKLSVKHALLAGLYFGGFQFLMPVIGWLLGYRFEALITSIDALAVGITFAFLAVHILPAAGLIGVTTFLISAVGIYVGYRFGARFRNGAERAGGVILILIGLKILLEHLGIL